MSSSSELKCGPLVDDGAPYNVIGITELKIPINQPNVSGISLDDKHFELSKYDFWKYGSGSHWEKKNNWFYGIIFQLS